MTQKLDCAMQENDNWIIGPLFYVETNSDTYVRLILTQFFAELTEEEQSYMRFQQDSATVHTTDNSLTALEGVFGDRIISPGLRAARLPDSSPCNYFFWGNMKNEPYRRNSHTKKNIQR
jgi:hypothetical protein